MLSNAIKFTLKNGFIQIKSKLIEKVQDLSFQDIQSFKEIILLNKNSKFIEFQVKDSGIGIKE